MEEFVARANIERFQKLISEESDDATRARLELMLAEQEEKLRALHRRPEAPVSRNRGGGVSDGQRP